MWSGSTIPTNWAVCDGTNNTPNLKDRFIVGAGQSYALGATGGASTVTLSIAEMPQHNHTITINDTGHSHSITEKQHSHSIQDPGHSHVYYFPTDSEADGENDGRAAPGGATNTSTSKTGISVLQASTGITSTNSHTTGITGTSAQEGGGQSHENKPPYFALYYIMRTT